MAWGDDLLSVAADAATAELDIVGGYYWDTDHFALVTSEEAVTWAAAAYGEAAASNQPVLDVAGACQIDAIVAYPSTGLGDSFVSYSMMGSPVVFTEAGTYTLTAMTLSVLNPE